jgi:hypothetical protein|nr:hypothetical protein [uncultured Undibacterium sp.]
MTETTNYGILSKGTLDHGEYLLSCLVRSIPASFGEIISNLLNLTLLASCLSAETTLIALIPDLKKIDFQKIKANSDFTIQ